MDGNRHEKISIVILSYVIGFTTAFIAYGLNELQSEKAVLYAPSVEAQVSMETDAEPALGLGIDAEGLYIVENGHRQMLSINKSSLSANALSGSPLPGYFTEIIDAKVSPNGQFVYFCEQIDASSETCDPYVLSLAEDILFPVTINGQRYHPDIASHVMTWHEGSILLYDGFASIDPMRPWDLESYTMAAEVNEDMPEMIAQ